MALRRSQSASQRYASIRKTGSAATAQTSYASTLVRRQQAAEDNYYDTAYSSGQITAEQYLNNLIARSSRVGLTPLQKQQLQEKVKNTQVDYQDQLIETAYKTGSLYNGEKVDTQYMLDRAQKKLAGMVPGNEAYAKQQMAIQGLQDRLTSEQDKASRDERKTYRQQQLLKLSTMREASSVELQNKANMYAQLEAMARADGEASEADGYLIQKNNLQQAADKASVTERIQDVNLANSQPVSPIPSQPSASDVASTESQFAGGQVPQADRRSVIDYYVNEAKNQGFTDPKDILQYIDNQGTTMTVTLPEIQQSLTEGMKVPTITPEVVQYAGIDLDKKVYDRIKVSKEIQSYLEKNAKMINEIQGEKGKSNGLISQISSQMNLVNVLRAELDKAKPDNRDALLKSYNDAVEKYNNLVQRKDDMMQKLQEQQQGFQEVVAKKASQVMKEQDSDFEKGLKTEIDNVQKDFTTGKLSKEEYVANLHGIAGTQFEGPYKQNLLTQLSKRGVKVNPGASFDEVAKAAVTAGLKTDAEITRDLYGLYGVGEQMYSLRQSLYDGVGDVDAKQKIGDLYGQYAVNRKRISENIVPNLGNLRVMQVDENNDKTINLTTMGYGVKRGEYTLVDPTAGAAQNGVSPEDAVKDWENNHIESGGVWYPVRADAQKSNLRSADAKKTQAEAENNFYFKKINPNNGKEVVVPVKSVDYGDGKLKYIPDAELKKLTTSQNGAAPYIVQQGNKYVRNFNAGQNDGMNPIVEGAMKVAASPVGTVLKGAAEALPFVGPIISAVDNLSKTTSQVKQGKPQAQNPVTGFLDMAKNAIIKPAVAADTTKKEQLKAFDFNQNPEWFDGFVAGVPDTYKKMIVEASKQTGVPTSLLSSLLYNESGFNPNAKSPVGALGIAQFMPETAKGMGVDPLNPESAINGAARYLKGKYDEHGKNWDLALAAYNAGSGNVYKYKGIPPFEETQNYVKKINALRGTTYAADYLTRPGMTQYLPTPTPVQAKPLAKPSIAPVKSAGVAEAYKPKSFWDQALETVGNIIAPPVSGQSSQSRPAQSSQPSQPSRSVSVPGQVVSPAAVRTQSNPAQQAAVASAYRSPNVTANPYTQQSVWTPPKPAPAPAPKPQPQQNFIQKAASTVSNWWNNLWKR